MDGLTILTSLLKVAGVLALVVFSLRLLGRFDIGRGTPLGAGAVSKKTSLIEILEQSRLDRTTTLAAVRIGDRVLLLGTTENGVETLADVSNDVDLRDDTNEPAEKVDVLSDALDMLRSGGFRSRNTRSDSGQSFMEE